VRLAGGGILLQTISKSPADASATVVVCGYAEPFSPKSFPAHGRRFFDVRRATEKAATLSATVTQLSAVVELIPMRGLTGAAAAQ